MGNDYEDLLNLMREYGPEMQYNFSFYMKGDMPSKKIDNVLKIYANDVDRANIIGIYDCTLSGSCKEGFAFTYSGMYFKESFEKGKSVKYSEIKEVSLTNISKTKDCDKHISIEKNDGTFISVTTTLINKSPLKEFLLAARDLSTQGKTSDNDKYLILEDMDERVKEKYIKIIVNFANCDNVISDVELSKLYSLMTRIKTDLSTREKVMYYISDDCSENTGMLLEDMDEMVPGSTLEAIHISLIKDMLIASGIKLQEFSNKQILFVKGITSKYSISEEQVKFIQEAIEIDKKLLAGDIDDKKYTKMMGDLGSKAAAVGVPIAAVYLSGSVVGLSAAGITSGLATLGLGGVLGLSSMVTGVGVVVLLGVAAYSGIKWVSGRGAKEKENKREYLLQEALRMNQETINNLIEDINNLTGQLMDAFGKNEINEEKIRRLNKKLVLYSNAFKQSRKEGNDMESSAGVGRV